MICIMYVCTEYHEKKTRAFALDRNKVSILRPSERRVHHDTGALTAQTMLRKYGHTPDYGQISMIRLRGGRGRKWHRDDSIDDLMIYSTLLRQNSVIHFFTLANSIYYSIYSTYGYHFLNENKDANGLSEMVTW